MRARALLPILAVLLGPTWVACSTASRGPVDAGSDVAADAREAADAGDAGDAGDARDARVEDMHVGPDREAAPPPTLTELSVDGDSDAGETLTPHFSPSIHDYYVRCAATSNAVMVSMTASPGADSQLIEPTTSPKQHSQTVPVNVKQNQAIVAVAASGADEVEYWVRCLPPDFPPMRMVRHPEAGVPPPGYYLLGTEYSPGMGYAIILNGDGVPVWYASSGVDKQDVNDFDFIGEGGVAYTTGYQQNRPIVVRNLTPPTTSYAAPVGYELDTHEVQVLANGNLLVISSPVVTGVDLTGVSVPLPDGGTQKFGPNSAVFECILVEFAPSTGTPVWTWKASDHFTPGSDSIDSTMGGSLPDGGPIVDVWHCNSIDIDPATQNLLVSARSLDSVFYVERPSGKILWKMGGSAYTMDGANFIPVAPSDQFYQQHDGRLGLGWSAECGTGTVSVFDDHSSQPGHARALVFDVVTGAPLGPTDGGPVTDCGAASAGPPASTVTFQYAGTQRSRARGSFRILADGSHVIGWGSTPSRTLPVFTEIDSKGADLLDFRYTNDQVSYRAIKVPLDTFDLETLRKTAGIP